MAIGNILNIPVKTTINTTMQSKSILVVGKSKAGKSTVCSRAPNPVFLMTENGGEMLTGFTPVPISSWQDFKNAVTQLCSSSAREKFDTVVIDTYTNLILLLDKYCGTKISTEKVAFDFGSDADYGKGAKTMKSELGFQLQRLANCGYLLLNIVHAEDKVDFETSKSYIGTSLSPALYGVAEKFVDSIIYLRKSDKPNKDGKFDYRTYFNPTGGFAGAGGRITPAEDYVPTSYENIAGALIRAIEANAKEQGATLVASETPSLKIEESKVEFSDLMSEFTSMVNQMLEKDPDKSPLKIKSAVEKILGGGKKVSSLNTTQGDLLSEIIDLLKATEVESNTETETEAEV